MFEVKNDRKKRTIYVRITAQAPIENVRRWSADCKAASESYGGQPHLLIADMRGVGVLAPEAAAVVGEVIEFTRRKGVRRCAHLSDSSIMRLQARRLAREVSGDDGITVEVVSIEEAERLFDEERRKLAAAPVAQHN
ncbi:MAG TPA: hypothetical protein VFS00_03775 [Polyangiaceae bacterium]|nr:hypothetical protein [Polyangiaceae bacterium]